MPSDYKGFLVDVAGTGLYEKSLWIMLLLNPYLNCQCYILFIK